MNKKLLSYIIILIFISVSVQAQEVLSGLSGNNRLDRKSTPQAAGVKAAPDTLELPVSDDFSYSGPYPDSIVWADKYVFINNTFTIDQVTHGVATFDLLDQTGRLYEDAATWSFRADLLTSNPVNLEYGSSENIWFSFLYQPGGIGDMPETGDSLTLQFYSPDTGQWHNIWKAAGSDHHRFKAVILPVTEERFLKKGFRFRFAAYGSLTAGTDDPAMKSSGDNWHVDNIKLDRNRHEADTILHDVSFTLPVRSLLKTHESIPLKHFRQILLSEMGSAITVNYRNNDNVIRNVTRQFEIQNLNTGITTHSFTGGATNTLPSTQVKYDAPLFYTFSTTGSDSVIYRIKSYLITDVFDPKRNDTLVYYQKFGNEFAIDDGSAEAGYGVTGQGSRNAMVAYRYRAFVPDSLRAIMINFNDSYLNSNLRAFDLAVWDNNNGTPGNVIYVEENIMVEQGEGINGFHTYILTDPVYVDNIFFIGWKQRSETFLNASVDLNTPHNGRQFYMLNGSWYLSQIDGTLMIRAITGPRIPSTGISDTYDNGLKVKIWPNPVSNRLNISTDERISGVATFKIIDLSGRVVMETGNVNSIDTSALRPGIYILLTMHNNVPVSGNRFIKAN
jgi:hypothetical protein